MTLSAFRIAVEDVDTRARASLSRRATLSKKKKKFWNNVYDRTRIDILDKRSRYVPCKTKLLNIFTYPTWMLFQSQIAEFATGDS